MTTIIAFVVGTIVGGVFVFREACAWIGGGR
jgi:Na+/H+ antiporter NhaC